MNHEEAGSARRQRRYEDHHLYADTGERRRATDIDPPRRAEHWPSWIQTALAVLTMLAALFLAFANLHERQALLEQSLRDLRQMYERHVLANSP